MFKKQFIPKKGINMKEEYYFRKFQKKINDKKLVNKSKFYSKLIYLINSWL
jgi:hypothetical protein